MIKTLMNSTSWTRPMWGPNDRGGGGGGDEDENLDDHQDDDDSENDADDSEEDEEINDDDGDALEALFKGDGDDDENNDDSNEDDDLEETQKNLATEMAEAVKKFGIPEDMIPEDFDPSDPKQFRKVVGDIQQATMRSTMAILFKPIHVSMERMMKDMRKEVDQRINGTKSEEQIRDMIVDAIPAAAKPGRYAIIKGIYDKALKKHKKPIAALQATKKSMKALGMPLGENRGSNRDDRETVLSGDDALDMFARLPARKSANSARDKVKNRLSR